MTMITVRRKTRCAPHGAAPKNPSTEGYIVELIRPYKRWVLWPKYPEWEKETDKDKALRIFNEVVRRTRRNNQGYTHVILRQGLYEIKSVELKLFKLPPEKVYDGDGKQFVPIGHEIIDERFLKCIAVGNGERIYKEVEELREVPKIKDKE